MRDKLHHKSAEETILVSWFEYTASFSTKSLKDDARIGGSISEDVRRVWSAAKQKGCKYEKGHNAQNSKLAKCLAMDSRRK